MASTSYNHNPSNSLRTRWDVFLSFRGLDTRYTFTDYLYNSLHRTGIQTFRDDPELRSGDVISDSLLQAIHESKTYVVILSKNYASSFWCLDELVEIINCYERMKRSVIVVFYNIDPSVVRHQTGSFKKAFEQHRIRFDMDRLDKWRATLTNLGNFSGYKVCKNMSHVDIINKVVDRVLLEVNPMTLEVATYPVGLDSRVKDLIKLFSSKKEGVIKIGLYGMGGVGKTTLAKAVYNQNCDRFQGSCFLANVREVSGTEKGLVCLQQQLISDILKCKNINIDNVDQGIVLIRARLCLRKVLIVIDDLEDPKPLEFLEGPLASGSIIIITTRNEDVLDSIKVEVRYKVNILGDADSRQLFAQHAFGESKISDTFMELSEEILKRAGGLPLALKVLGSNLLNQSEEGWRWFIDKLKRVSINDVDKKLVVSFDALKLVDPMLQDIFLDIACFFIGWKKEEVAKIMKTCYTFIEHNIDILKKRCLLTINNRDELRMHDLLRDTGRKIACKNSPDEPGKHSRLWALEDIYDVLKKHKGTEAIEGIIHGKFYYEDALEGVSFATETFKRMSKLRFLYLKHVNLTGSFERTLENLRFLRWDYCPLKFLPSEFCPQKLVTLELCHSKIRTMWRLNMDSQVFEKLRTLNMSNSLDLITTPDFTKLPCLETLNLENCRRLVEVHKSIGSLARLVFLNLNRCENLRSLPDTICNLRALEVLSIDWCRSLEALPIEMGNIEILRELNAKGLTILKLPVSIGCLIKLVKLKLSSNKNLKTLPDTICNFRGLEVLSIWDCISLEALPKELGSIESLKEIDASGLNVSKLPVSIGRLSKLVNLGLNNNKNLETLPDTICNLRGLEVLSIRNCMSLEALPKELGSIISLKELDASGLTISKLPVSIGRLSRLVNLGLNNNKSLETLPNTICNLRGLEVGNCTSLESLPIELGNIESLKELNVDTLSVSNFPNSIRRLSKLVKLDLSYNMNLKNLWHAILDLRALEVLSIGHCTCLEELPMELGYIESLKKLNVQGLTVSKLPVSIGRLSKLVELDLSFNKNLESLPDTICNLRVLEFLKIDYCKSLEALPIELGNIESLVELSVNGSSFSKLPVSIGRLSKLVELKLNCNNFETLPDTICGLRSLKNLHISGCNKLGILPDQLWKITSLRNLYASRATLLKQLPDIELSQIAFSLQRLDISDSVITALPSGISQLSNLHDLFFRDCCHLLSVAELPPNLKRIKAEGCTSLLRLLNLSNLKQLEVLDLTDCCSLREIQGLKELTSITKLHLGGCNSSILANTFTRRFFQTYSGYGHEIKIFTSDFPDWIGQSSNLESTVCLDLPPNASHNLLATILCFKHLGDKKYYNTTYSLKNTKSDFIRDGGVTCHHHGALMIIIPRSNFSVRDGDDIIELIANADICGIHLLYRTDNKMTSSTASLSM